MLITMTLWGAVLIAVVALIRFAALHRLAKRAFPVLWAFVLLRLLVPVSIPVIETPAIERIAGQVPPTAAAWLGLERSAAEPAGMAAVRSPGIGTDGNTARADKAATEASGKDTADRQTPLFTSGTLRVFWLTGVIALAAYFLISHVRHLQRFRTSLPVDTPAIREWLAAVPLRRRVQVRRSDRIHSPLTYGIRRPVILLPKSMDLSDEEQLHWVLTHELTHIRRFDAVFKWLLAAAACIHWFNPFVWLMFVLANRDLELSCDEAVVRTIGYQRKSAYALTLIRMAESRSKLAALYSGFSKHAIEERVVAVMKIRKTNLWAVLTVLVLAAGTLTTFAASATASPSLEKYAGIPELDPAKHAGHINRPATADGEGAGEGNLSISSTLFTDHRAYAVIRLHEETAEPLEIRGRITDTSSGWTYYPLVGEVRELAPGDGEDGYRQFLYAGTIAPQAPSADTDPQLALAAGDRHHLKDHSLWWESEGKVLELTVALDGTEHVLTAPVTNVYTDWIVVHPEARHYDGADFYDTVALTPNRLLLTGASSRAHEELWFGPYFDITLVMEDKTSVNIRYDTRGLISDEFYPTAGSQGYDETTGAFYAYLDFRGWEVDLSQVAALIIDGTEYPVKRK
jgi:beta-lactamase regulating signal transducer with metallopeptidase domain